VCIHFFGPLAFWGTPLDIHIVACRLNAEISESERASIARQRPSSHVSCTTEVTFSWQWQGKCLFSQQRKERFHDDGGINCSIRCSLVGKPRSYERECIHEQNTEIGIEAKSSEAKFTEVRTEGTEQKWEESREDQRCKTRTTVRDSVSSNSWICELL
jgi:hypothetical protein